LICAGVFVDDIAGIVKATASERDLVRRRRAPKRLRISTDPDPEPVSVSAAAVAKGRVYPHVPGQHGPGRQALFTRASP
jgi:hypothetical protein